MRDPYDDDLRYEDDEPDPFYNEGWEPLNLDPDYVSGVGLDF